MMGPNTLTGHLSVIYTVECQVNFTMRVIDPIMRGLSARHAGRTSRNPDSVMVTAEAEQADGDWVQERCKELVWATGCTSWFIEPETCRNTLMYPDYPTLYWLLSVWIPWNDFPYAKSKESMDWDRAHPYTTPRWVMAVAVIGVVGGLATAARFEELEKVAGIFIKSF